MSLVPGDVFAGYTVIRQLGSGGMGAVYLVRHPRLPRLEALKLLRAELSADPSFAARFRREAAAAAALRHRNVVAVRDQGEEDGQLWLIMDYVDGRDAEHVLHEAGGILPVERVLHIVSEVAAGLDAAHRQRLVHRDVKPANVLLTGAEEGEPEQIFLTDFGIAKSLDSQTAHTATGAVLATFDYAAPEQIESRPVDGRADVYALGCLLVRMLTGEVPYPGGSIAGAISGHLVGAPPRPTQRIPWLAPGIDAVVARALAKDPADRYPTGRALAEAAREALTDQADAPDLPYTLSLTRADGTGAPVRVHTACLAGAESEQLVRLVRQTRLFHLPQSFGDGEPVAGSRRLVTLEVAGSGRSNRVSVDLDARRPAELDELVVLLDRLATGLPPAGRAVPTVVGAGTPAAERSGPPTTASRPSTPRRKRQLLLAGALLGLCAVVAAALVVSPLRQADRATTSSSTTSRSGAVPAGSDNGEARKTGPDVALDAAEAMEEAGAVRARGTLTANDRTQTIDVLYQGTWNAWGTITIGGQTGEAIATAGEDYLKAPAGFWPTQGLAPPNVPDVAGTWVHMPRAAADIAFPMSLGGLVYELRHPETAAVQDAVTRATFGGQPVVVVALTDGSSYDVAATGPPYVLRMRSFGTRPGEVTFGDIGHKTMVRTPDYVEYVAVSGG